VKPEYQDRIQHDIQNSSKKNRKHSCFSESLCINKIIHSQTDYNKKRSKQIYCNILICVGPAHITCAKKIQKGTFEDQAEDHKDSSGYEKKDEGIPHHLFCLFLI